MKALARGDLAAAWRLHPWVVLLAVQGVFLLLILALTRFSPTVRMQLRRSTVPILIANGAFAAGLWVLRLALGQIPVPFG